MGRLVNKVIYAMKDGEISRYIDIPGTSSIHLLSYDGAFIVYDYKSSTVYEFK